MRTKDDVQRYVWRVEDLLFGSALALKNAVKASPENESLGALVKKLAEEVGEVAEAIIEEDYEQARSEIGDVLWAATMLGVRILVAYEEKKAQYPAGY